MNIFASPESFVTAKLTGVGSEFFPSTVLNQFNDGGYFKSFYFLPQGECINIIPNKCDMKI